MFKVASWNLNSVRSRLTHVTTWLKAREPDVLLLQELKGTEFPSEAFKSLGYESVAVTQKPRARYRAMLGLGYTDAFRSLHVGEIGHFTFWDYFRQAFKNNRGIRIDHFLLSPSLANQLESCEIDKGPRGLEKPSDHTPIIVTLSDLNDEASHHSGSDIREATDESREAR